MEPAMTLRLHLHPLSSYCWKALIAFHEAGVPFEPAMLNLGDAYERARFYAMWPIGKMPVLEDTEAGLVLPETSVIIEYLAATHPAARGLVPTQLEAALEARLMDRVFDLYVQGPMQRVTNDRLRPAEQSDPVGVAQAKADLRKAYGFLDQRLKGRAWAAGAGFTLADCAAAPALFYADRMAPIGAAFPTLAGYKQRLEARPSVARVLAEAQPYMHMVPQAREAEPA
jgi:glutathione S-transferase